ncbi:MAG: sugar ABC transporter permease [Chloroflexi bacterium]|nr:sugar ABC transporter permease [Chloroflexota bacterium]
MTRTDRLLGPLMAAPMALIVLGLSAIPMGYSVWLALHSYSPLHPDLTQFVGLGNFAQMASDGRVWADLRVTVVIAAIGVPGSLVLGMLVALLLNQDVPGMRLFRAVAVTPMMIMPLLVGLTFQELFDYRIGLVNYLLSLAGVPPVHWLDQPFNAVVTVILMDLWFNTPFVTLVLLAGLRSLPPEPHEAARVDGAGAWQAFWRITLPLLRPLVLVAALLRLIGDFKLFDQIYSLTQAGPGNATEVLAYYVFVLGFKQFNLGYAAAVSYLLLAILAIAGLVLIRQLNPRLPQRERVG